MARGHQKIQSQQKAQEAAAKRKKAEGHSAKDQKNAATAALKAKCSVCMVSHFKVALMILRPNLKALLGNLHDILYVYNNNFLIFRLKCQILKHTNSTSKINILKRHFQRS